MSETLIVALIGAICSLISIVISFLLGRRAERQKQSITIKAELLKPIDDWLKGVEKLTGMFADTVVAISENLQSPVNYAFPERKLAMNFMSEKTNEVLGIISSKSLQTRRSKGFSQELSIVIEDIDQIIKV